MWPTRTITGKRGLRRDWENPSIGNFDSWGGAMLTLFQAVTADTLPDLMIHGMDTVGADAAPVPVTWSWSGLYFVLWIRAPSPVLAQ